jgi:hypothetical protein
MGLQHLIAAMPSIQGNPLVAGDGRLRNRLCRQAANPGIAGRARFLAQIEDLQLKAGCPRSSGLPER